jgi:hypothetical protein
MDLAVDQGKVRSACGRLRLGEQLCAAQSAEGERAGTAEELSAEDPSCGTLLNHVRLIVYA